MAMFRTLERKPLYRGKVVNLRIDTLDLGGGHQVQREIVEHRGAVVVAALDPQERVLLVRQYRHATGETLLELPAGTLEPGEEPLATAIRELQEETGFYPGHIEKTGGFYSAPGFCTEFLHLFVARDLRPQPLDGDIDEEIEVVPVDLGRVPELVVSGQVKDAKSIAGLYVLELLAREPRPGGRDRAHK